MWGGVLVALRMSMWNSYLFECIWNLFLTGIYAQTFHRVTVVCSRHHWSLLYVTDIIGHCCMWPTSLVTVVYVPHHWSLLYMTDIIDHCCIWPTSLVTVVHDRHYWSLFYMTDIIGHFPPLESEGRQCQNTVLICHPKAVCEENTELFAT